MRRSRSLIGSTLVVAVLVLVTAGGGVLVALGNFASANRTVLAVRDRQVALERVLSVMRDAETGQRGFLLTQREEYLEPYTAALDEIEPLLARLARLAEGDPQQQALGELQAQVAQPWGGAIRLVALTGWGQASDRVRALEAGFDEHWVKPVDGTLAVEFARSRSPRDQ